MCRILNISRDYLKQLTRDIMNKKYFSFRLIMLVIY